MQHAFKFLAVVALLAVGAVRAEPALGDGRMAYALGQGPLWQADVGATHFGAGVLLERAAPSEAAAQPWRLQYQWQVHYRWKPLMNFGLQGVGDLGASDGRDRREHWRGDGVPSHRAGPALLGQFDFGQGRDSRTALLYQAAYLIGSVATRRGNAFTVRLQYTF